MASLRQKLSSIRQRLGPAKPAYQPRLAPADFPAGLGDTLGTFNERFIYSPGALLNKIETLAGGRTPYWRNRTLEQVQRWQNEGLPTYAATGTALNRNFDWRGPEPFASRDDLYRLRPHRFAFAPHAALACHYDPAHIQWFDEILEHWITSTQTSEAPWAYRSSLVAIQRLLGLSFALAITDSIESARSENLTEKLLRIIAGDLHYLGGVAGNSVANNHLLADRFFLWYGQYLFPGIMSSKESEEELEQAWLEELERQTYSSGGGFEHSLHYHEFDTELALLYYLIKLRAGKTATREINERLQLSVALQARLGSSTYPAMAYGNATEDPMLPLDPSFRWAPYAWLDVHNWLEPGRNKHEDISCRGETAYWLLPGTSPGGIPGTTGTTDTQTTPWIPHRFVEAGIYCFDHEASDMQLVFRSGPRSGSPTFFGHAHADLNSITATVNGANMLVDGGTYTYRRGTDIEPNPGTDWREYFAGARAHNGLALEGLSPLGEFRGDFRPFENATSAEITLDLNDGDRLIVESRIRAENAYNGCRRGIIHAPGQFTVIYDVLTAQALSHDPRFLFQLGLDVGIENGVAGLVENDTVLLKHSSGPCLQFCPSSDLALSRTLQGSTAPVGGWVSNSYGDLQAAPQFVLAPCSNGKHIPDSGGSRCSAVLLVPGAGRQCDIAVEEVASGEISCSIHLDNSLHEIVIPPVPDQL